MSSAWVYQDNKQVKERGEDNASWYVGWIDPEGKKRCKSCGPGKEGKKAAEKLRKKREAELIEGTYKSAARKTWKEFREEYEQKIVSGLAVRSRAEVKLALDSFERLAKPARVGTIKTATIDAFIAVRRLEPGKKPGDLISPATVNKDLRHVKAALAVAVEWGCLGKLPKCRMEKARKKLARYVTPEHFAAIYGACDKATLPARQPFPAAAWWRALFVMAYMTGWRISEIIALRREDLDLDGGFAITRGDDNKGKRDEKVKLHPVVVEHLKALPGFSPLVFAWPHNRTILQRQLARIQEAAGIRLSCAGKHKHSRFCYVYGFHDWRRAFATMNADKLTGDALQALMRHKSYQTTQVYINMARQMDEAVAALHVPEVLRTGTAK